MANENEVQKIIDEKVKPALQNDGGDIQFNRIEDDIVYVTLQGACAHCMGAVMTLKQGVERVLKESFPEIKEVRNEPQSS